MVVEGKHTRLRSPDQMELIELRLFPMAPLTPRGVLSEDIIFFGGFYLLVCFRICELRVYLYLTFFELKDQR